jgi:hypothetical protein
MTTKGTLRVKVEKATFNTKVKKIQLLISNAADNNCLSKTNVLHAKKDVTEAVWNEVLEFSVDPNQGIEIALETAKKVSAVRIEKISKLKLVKGEAKPVPINMPDFAQIDLIFTALDFGLAPAKKVAKSEKNSSAYSS